MAELIFYTNPMSRGRMVRWMLEETGEAYSTELLDYSAIKTPPYLAINPMGKIPAIKHGDTIVTECAAICAYLADAFPAANLAPPVNSPERGAYYRWLFFAAGPLEAAITNKALGVVVPPEREAMVGYGNFTAVMDTLEQAVSRSLYLAGDQFTAADLYVGAQIIFGLRFGSIEKRPAFKTYVDRLAERPACRRAAAIDDALIPAPAA
jgi:glutathione S-transferase